VVLVQAFSSPHFEELFQACEGCYQFTRAAMTGETWLFHYLEGFVLEQLLCLLQGLQGKGVDFVYTPRACRV
jgi:hypothetical protein